jgi:hypothetical protein
MAIEPDRTIDPRDEVVIIGAYENNRPMGERENTNEDVMGTADCNLSGSDRSAG